MKEPGPGGEGAGSRDDSLGSGAQGGAMFQVESTEKLPAESQVLPYPDAVHTSER